MSLPHGVEVKKVQSFESLSNHDIINNLIDSNPPRIAAVYVN